MELTYQLIDDLAELARLHVADSEKESLRNDMEKMILFFKQLQSVNTEGLAPLLHMTEEINKLRTDDICRLITRETALKSGAKTSEAFFLVPKVIKK
jgi:aspartyl-tRNA(Asn)/glutamyl-tRNA(Gln) amidotransferase subunit C